MHTWKIKCLDVFLYSVYENVFDNLPNIDLKFSETPARWLKATLFG